MDSQRPKISVFTAGLLTWRPTGAVQKPRSVHDFPRKKALFNGQVPKHLYVADARHRGLQQQGASPPSELSEGGEQYLAEPPTKSYQSNPKREGAVAEPIQCRAEVVLERMSRSQLLNL